MATSLYEWFLFGGNMYKALIQEEEVLKESISKVSVQLLFLYNKVVWDSTYKWVNYILEKVLFCRQKAIST